jgi:hypothetical protein
VVELEPELQQQPALDVRILEARIAGYSPDGAEQDGVVVGDRREVLVGEGVPRLQEPAGTQRESRAVEADARQ